MPAGLDMQLGAAKESAYGTRVAPTRFFEVISESIDFAREYYVSRGLGGGIWKKRRVQTTRAGGGGFQMEVPTAGFGFWLDLLHPNAVTPVQQATTTAYKQTHSLSGAPTKSATVQVGVPPLSGAVLPFDYVGVMIAEATFSWEPGGVLTFEPTLVIKDEQTNQVLATLTPPADYGLFSFKGGAITIAGAAVANIIGGGSVTVSWPLRDDAFVLGGDGTMAKPVPTDRPAMRGELTADFDGMTHYNRVTGGTLADVVVTFEGVTIASTYKEQIRFTIPDAGFSGPRPNVDGPGPVQQTLAFDAASTTGDVPTIEYTSTDATV